MAVSILAAGNSLFRVWIGASLGWIMFEMTSVPEGTVTTQPSFAISDRRSKHGLFSDLNLHLRVTEKE